MRSTWCSLNKFDGSLAQKRVLRLESEQYDYNLLFVLTVFGRFFSWIRIRIFCRSGLRKKVRSGSGEKDPDTKHCYKCSRVNSVALTSRPPGWGRQSPPCWRRQSWRGWRACSPQTRRGSAAQHPAQYTITVAHNQCCGLRSRHFLARLRAPAFNFKIKNLNYNFSEGMPRISGKICTWVSKVKKNFLLLETNIFYLFLVPLYGSTSLNRALILPSD